MNIKQRQKYRDRNGRYTRVNQCYHCGKSAGLAYLLQNPAVKGDESDLLKNRLQRLHTPLSKISVTEEENDGASN